ncbi:MAG: hypothetical protein BWY15_00637 [Firmicutes bacterium ADurb.Bin193]|nr:MAG: hypothetical protein BWY15_00637 [Firmicutes bacterium ADurb.Bin193]
MKEKTKFIWLYSVLLFSAAVLLILISSLSQSRLSPSETLTQQSEQQAFNQTVQKSITDLIKENEALKESLGKANDRIKTLEGEAQSAEAESISAKQTSEATEFLLEAELLFNKGRYAESRNTLQNVNALILSEQGRQLYDWLSDKLIKKGYKLQG